MIKEESLDIAMLNFYYLKIIWIRDCQDIGLSGGFHIEFGNFA